MVLKKEKQFEELSAKLHLCQMEYRFLRKKYIELSIEFDQYRLRDEKNFSYQHAIERVLASVRSDKTSNESAIEEIKKLTRELCPEYDWGF